MEFITMDGENVFVNLTVHGYSYGRKKRSAVCVGIVAKSMMETYRFTAEQEKVIRQNLHTIASRFGLLTEFKNLGIF